MTSHLVINKKNVSKMILTFELDALFNSIGTQYKYNRTFLVSLWVEH